MGTIKDQIRDKSVGLWILSNSSNGQDLIQGNMGTTDDFEPRGNTMKAVGCLKKLLEMIKGMDSK